MSLDLYVMSPIFLSDFNKKFKISQQILIKVPSIKLRTNSSSGLVVDILRDTDTNTNVTKLEGDVRDQNLDQ
jgi:hypothetical protein